MQEKQIKQKKFPSDNLFTRHPHSVNETYLQHFNIAFGSSVRLIIAGFACLIHSIFPFLFIHTASNTVQQISAEMTERQNRNK